MTGEGHCPRELWCNQPAAQKDDFAYLPEPIVGVCQKWWRLWFPGGQALERRSKLVKSESRRVVAIFVKLYHQICQGRNKKRTSFKDAIGAYIQMLKWFKSRI
jgi:hypothetical protein